MNVFPRPAMYCTINRRGSNSKNSGQFDPRLSLFGSASYLSDFFFRQLRSTRIPSVVPARDVVQIAREIVVALIVSMVYVVTLGARAEEGFNNEFVRVESSRFSIAAEHDRQVAVGFGGLFENPPGDGIAVASSYAFHASFVGDLVPAFVTNYTLPLFFRHIGEAYPLDAEQM